MENFASHLEEVFITVEVRARLMTQSDTHCFHQLCLVWVRESVFLEHMVSVLLLFPHPSFCPPVAQWARTCGTDYLAAYPTELLALMGWVFGVFIALVLRQGRTLSWASLIRHCKTPILSLISVLFLGCYLFLTRSISFCACHQTCHGPLGVPSMCEV